MKKLTKITVTSENLEDIREQIPALDQQQELKVGQVISTWPVYYEPGAQRGQLTVWHEGRDECRAALCLGGDSAWGRWSEEEGFIPDDDG